jgi:phosphate transport system substrate-binding protein
LAALIPTLPLLSCGSDDASAAGSLSGSVQIDGSSTVSPISEAVAEEFGKVQTAVKVTVGISGTGGGFKRFALGETDINDASRPIKEAEATTAKAKGIDYIELPIAYDGIAIVTHKDNDFLQHITVEQLRQIWQPGSTVKTWSDVDPAWPKREIKLYGAGTDSGTFDYFTDAINGKEKACRSDYTASEDDNQLVLGVAGDRDSLGFFGIAYYVENKQRLKLIPVDSGAGPIAPSEQTINDGTYKPLSRPLFIYVRPDALQKNPAVAAFVEFYLQHAPALAREVGYVALPDEIQKLTMQRLKSKQTGTMFTEKREMTLLERMRSSTH